MSPVGIGKQILVDVSVDPRGITDVYIDSTISLCVDIQSLDNALRLENTMLLTTHKGASSINETEPIPRDKMTALAKLPAEASLEETKMILGLFFHFREIIVAFHSNKYVAWKRDVA